MYIYVARLICLLVYTQIIDRYELYYCIQLLQNGILKSALASLQLNVSLQHYVSYLQLNEIIRADENET